MGTEVLSSTKRRRPQKFKEAIFMAVALFFETKNFYSHLLCYDQ
ncbi:hypothetical protein RV08_GL000448 [Enterococcus mundtii]|nr:hypothetical protein RV08_GL000448 [Enterococcus mundtii]